MRRSKESEEADVRRDWYGEALADNPNIEGCRDDRGRGMRMILRSHGYLQRG